MQRFGYICENTESFQRGEIFNAQIKEIFLIIIIFHSRTTALILPYILLAAKDPSIVTSEAYNMQMIN